MFWGYFLSYQAVVYGEESNEMNVSLGNRQWEGEYHSLRILTGKKHPKMKRQCLQKKRIWTFGLLVYQINSFYKVQKLKQIFKKNKVITGKTPLFVIGPAILIALTLASDRSFELRMICFQS